MKKIILFIFLITISKPIYATPITSQLYIPEAGKMLNTLIFANKQNKSNNIQQIKALSLDLNGLFGLTETLSLHYNLEYVFNAKQEYEPKNQSSEFNYYYIGFINRMFENDFSMVDVEVNVGENELRFYGIAPKITPTINANIKYGLNFEYYNIGFSIGTEFFDKYTKKRNEFLTDTQDKMINYLFSLENEVVLLNILTINFNFYYKWNDDIINDYTNTKEGEEIIYENKYKLKDNFRLNTSINYSITPNNYIGLYYEYEYFKLNYTQTTTQSSSNISRKYNESKIKIHSFGARLTTYF